MAKKTISASKKTKVGRAKLLARPTARAAPKKAAAKTRGPKPWTAEEIREAFLRFQKANPDPRGELEHLNPYTLVVAVALSAQATDAGVNKATRNLFPVADTPQKMLALGEDKVREYIKTIGLYRNKAKNVIALSQKLIDEFGGEVPRSREALQSLPGVGRKTANVVLNMAWRTNHGGRHPRLPCRQPHRPRARQGSACRGAGTGAGDPRRVHAARASLADPARPLHLRRTQAALRGLSDQRPVQVAGEDRAGLVPPI
jgi:hypothetical protein